MIQKAMYIVGLLVLFAPGCGDGTSVGEADQLGVGGACMENLDCPDTAPQCLTSFKGGYCGIEGCEEDADCPENSLCVSFDDGEHYCFRTCEEKEECNANRPEEVWANCSANVTFVEPQESIKACVPPSGK